MEVDLIESFYDFIGLYPLLSRLLLKTNKKISYFISFIYLMAIVKLKPKILGIKSVSIEYLDELYYQNNFKTNFFGDLASCALISINTLAALSVPNQSWLKIAKVKTKVKEKSSESNKKATWEIKMPPVEDVDNTDNDNYYIQCVVSSKVPRDFVLYVTDVKLFNISTKWSKSNSYCESVQKVMFNDCDYNYSPKIAKSAVVAGISSAYDWTSQDCEDILNEHFSTPKFLKVNEIFEVSLYKFKKPLQLKSNSQNVFFKVISLKGESEKNEYYVVKDYTNLYLRPTGHGYLPPKNYKFIWTQKYLTGFNTSLCPTGLLKYYTQLQKMILPFLKNNDLRCTAMFLLHGKEGVGKKTTVKSVASSFGLHFFQVDCFEFYGLNPTLVQGKFDQLFAKVRRIVPCVIYLENIELLGREQGHQEDIRLIDIFETHIRELWVRKADNYPLIIFGSTHLNLTESVPAIVRLFLRTVAFEAPNFEETCQMLKWLVKNSNMVCSSADIVKASEKVKGYVFADLALLVKHAIRYQSEDGSDNVILLKHFNKGIEIMEGAYSDSIGAARVPTVHWEDVGGLEELKEEVMLTLNLPLKHPELFPSGLRRSGIMFYGPPGTGKTLMAKAIATECNYSFLSVKGPELMNMYVGQSEKNIRDVFERAREASPCIIFFDELDSLAPSRGRSGDSGGVTDRVVSQLLAEMDGLENNKNVFVIAATNRPDLVDPALLRPGRFDKMFYVGICKDKKYKLSVLKALTRRFCLSVNVDFEKIIDELPTEVTGADLYSVCSNAWFSAARSAVNAIENGSQAKLPLEVSSENFKEAVQQFVPSVTKEDMKYYEELHFSEGSKLKTSSS